MTKTGLIETLAAKFDISKREAGDIIDMLLDEIKSALKSGDKVQLIPFGSFVVRDRKKREGRNPKTGDKIVIAARRVPAFSAGKALRDAVGGVRKKPAVTARARKAKQR